MPLKPHPTDPDKMVFDNKDRIAAIEKSWKQEGVCAKCGGIVYDPVIPQLGWQGLTEEEIDGFGEYAELALDYIRLAEAKLKEKNGL